MTTIIRRAPRKRLGPITMAALIALLLAAGVLALAWYRTAPRPVGEMAIALPDPVPAAGGAR